MSRADEIFRRLISDCESAVDGLIADFQSENLWLDFKRSRNDGNGTKLQIDDRESLAKAISGFGNSAGGVIVWGVDCRRDPKTGADLPGSRHPIAKPHRFVSWLESTVSSCTAPAHRTVEHAALRSSDSDAGYVITLVPESVDAPLQCIQPTDRLQYYIRVGSNFVPAPHAVLAGLFGRRPQPRVAQKWFGQAVSKSPPTGLGAVSILSLSNSGRSIARDLYVNIFAYPPGPNCVLKFVEVDPLKWERHDVAGNVWNAISRESYRLAPGASVHVGALNVEINPPLTRPLTLDVSYGCEGGEPRQWRVDVSPEAIGEVCVNLHDNKINGNDVMKVLFGAIE